MSKKVILVLLDGISANYFKGHRARMPYLSRLANNGLLMRLKSDVPSVSLCARATMLTGKTPAEHGVYGNQIYDLQLNQFRYGAPDDISVPTLPELALAQGLSVANIGFGMGKSAHAQTFCPPWWLQGYIHKGREATSDLLPEVSGWSNSSTNKDELGLLQSLFDNGLAKNYPNESHFDHVMLADFAAENAQLQRVAGLLAGDNPPDFMLTEISMTDDAQHRGGYGSELAHFSMQQADMQIGLLLNALEYSGRTDEYVFALAADHGHTTIDTALYPEAFLPTGTQWSSEGSILHVFLPRLGSRQPIIDEFAAYDVVVYNNDYLPESVRSDLLVFLAPDRVAFEIKPDGVSEGIKQGKPRYISSHGLRPGHPDDDRLCIFSGAGIQAGEAKMSESIDFAAAVASILDVKLSTMGRNCTKLSTFVV